VCERICIAATVSRLFIARETTTATVVHVRGVSTPPPEMERSHYLSGSFDGLSDDQHHVHHQRQYFKSSFAKSMALETTKSLNFADLDLTGNDRYNTVGSQRQVILEKLEENYNGFPHFSSSRTRFRYCHSIIIVCVE